METKEKVSLSETILPTFIGFISFFAMSVIIGMILSILLNLIASVPVIGALFLMLTNIEFLEINDFSLGISLLITVYYTCIIVSRIAKNKPAGNLSCKILGAIIILIYGISLILNFTNGEPLLASAMITVAGIAIFFHDRILEAIKQ